MRDKVFEEYEEQLIDIYDGKFIFKIYLLYVKKDLLLYICVTCILYEKTVHLGIKWSMMLKQS